MITPIEIRQHQFKKAMRGFDKNEVQSFLNTVSLEYERNLDELKRAKQDLEKAQKENEKHREVESVLHRTLLQAEETSKSTIETAKKNAEDKVSQAESRAHEIVSKAIAERERIGKQIDQLIQRRSEILTQLQQYLSAQTERLKSFEEKEMHRYEAPEFLKENTSGTVDKPTAKAPEKSAVPTRENPSHSARSKPETKDKSEEVVIADKTPAVAAVVEESVKVEARKETEKIEEKVVKATIEPVKTEEKPGAKPDDKPASIDEKKAQDDSPQQPEKSVPSVESTPEKAPLKVVAKKPIPQEVPPPKTEASQETNSDDAQTVTEDKPPRTKIVIQSRKVEPKPEEKPSTEARKSFFDRNVQSESSSDVDMDDILDDL